MTTLTQREVEIMDAAIDAKDLSTKFLMVKFNLAKPTVSAHKLSIFRKLGADSAVKAVLLWQEQGRGQCNGIETLLRAYL